MAGKKREEVREEDVTGLKYFDKLAPLLARLHDVGCGRDKAGNRLLHFDQYCMLVLLFLFNPVVRSLRAIQQASQLRKVQRKLGCLRASLASLSEAKEVFQPERLKEIIAELGEQLEPIARDLRLKDVQHTLTLVDRSLLSLLQACAGLPASAQPRSGGYRDSDLLRDHRLHAHQPLDGPQADAANVRDDLPLLQRPGGGGRTTGPLGQAAPTRRPTLTRGPCAHDRDGAWCCADAAFCSLATLPGCLLPVRYIPSRDDLLGNAHTLCNNRAEQDWNGVLFCKTNHVETRLHPLYVCRNLPKVR